MRATVRHGVVLGIIVLLAGAAPAPGGKAGPAAPVAPAATTAGVGALPQQTTATFGDWVLRCSRPAGTAKACELAQGVQREGKAVAEMAIGAAAPGQRLRFTLLVPTNVSFATAPVMTADGNGAGLSMTWRRCLPGGCIADAEIGEDALSRLRSWSQPGRIVFTDGTGRAATIPVSPLGLPQALDALTKEDAG